MTERPVRAEDQWDRFIDNLDRAGQAGGAHAVVVPESTGAASLAGRLFGELTRKDVDCLSRIANSLGRRGETIKTLWDDTRRRLKPPRRAHRQRG